VVCWFCACKPIVSLWHWDPRTVWFFIKKNREQSPNISIERFTQPHIIRSCEIQQLNKFNLKKNIQNKTPRNSDFTRQPLILLWKTEKINYTILKLSLQRQHVGWRVMFTYTADFLYNFQSNPYAARESRETRIMRLGIGAAKTKSTNLTFDWNFSTNWT
jgi:hypothetical protein